jgi:TonB family protein
MSKLPLTTLLACSILTSIAATASASETSLVSAFPDVIDSQTPQVDRFVNMMRTRIADRISVEVELCVSPTGEVARVTVHRGSGYAALDAALARDLAAWRFEAMPGPTSVRMCTRTTLVYRAP